MSDAYLRYAPLDPHFVPSAAACADAEALLRGLLPRAQAMRSFHSDDVMFVDCGANWSGVQCSACGADAEPWWGDAMSEALARRPASLQVVARCCGATVSLPGLKYGWPVAFARYMLEALNPDSRGLSPAQHAALSAALGTRLVEVPCHL